MEKIRDSWGDLKGYKLGDYYLLKRYGFKNNYSWILTKNYWMHSAFNVEFDRALDNKEVVLVWNCKRGKELLQKLAAGEIKLEELKRIA